MFGAIASEEVALNRRANAGAKVGDNVWEMEALVGSARGDCRGMVGRGAGYLLDRVVAEIAGEVRTLFMFGRSHGTGMGRSTSDRGGDRYVFKDATSPLSPTGTDGKENEKKQLRRAIHPKELPPDIRSLGGV